MSGSGGGGGVGGGGGGSESCSSLGFVTSLNSPKPDVISTIKVGEVLDVEAQASTGPAVVVTKSGEIAGSLTTSKLLRLLECIEEGFSYLAEVKEISGGDVQVEVRPG